MSRKSKQNSKKSKAQEDQGNLSDWSEDSIEVQTKDKSMNSFFDDLIKAPPVDTKALMRSQAQKNKIKDDVRQHNDPQAMKTTLEEKISKVKAKLARREKFKEKFQGKPPAEMDDEEDDDEPLDEEEERKAIENMEEIKGSDDEEPEEDEEENKKGTKVRKGASFAELNLIKPLLKACSEIGYSHATPIQKLAIPPALIGRDVLASAVTGSGKTAAFLLPIMQTYFNQSLSGKIHLNTTRALIILPTRELAMQCYEMFNNLNKYTRLSCALIIGSSSMEKQRAELNRNPLIVIATPGRIIDHLQNSKGFDMDDVDMLVLDEADKLLELGFMYELKEIIKGINPEHQTLLFSATLAGQVSELIQLALKKPIRVSANPDFSIARKLRQEYIKIRSGERYLRDATLLCVAEEFKKRVIIFFKTKSNCHRIAVLFGLLGFKFKELHGNLSQTDRIEALEHFRENKVDYLLSTDLVARGIDIKQVKTVINFELPTELTKYIHRVGRTARAGESGTSITIVDEREHQKLKAMIKQSKDKIFKKEVDANKVESYRTKVQNLEGEVKNVFKMESFEKELIKAEQAASRAENLLNHQDEIYNRPRKTWIVTPKQKRELSEQQRKVYGEDEGEHEEQPDQSYSNAEQKLMGKKIKQKEKGTFRKNPYKKFKK